MKRQSNAKAPASWVKMKWFGSLARPAKALDCKEHTQAFMVLCIYSLKEYLSLSFDVPSSGNKYTKGAVLI